jgi:Leucine-rich repeat (LRR) protein
MNDLPFEILSKIFDNIKCLNNIPVANHYMYDVIKDSSPLRISKIEQLYGAEHLKHFYISKKLYMTKKLKFQTSLPEEIGCLKNLIEIDISYSPIIMLPKSIVNLIGLKSLYVYKSKLSEIPENIGNLINLNSLVISFTDVSYIPKSIKFLKNLKNLDLSHNKIRNMPIISNLQKLKHLNLDHNEISDEEISYIKGKILS